MVTAETPLHAVDYWLESLPEKVRNHPKAALARYLADRLLSSRSGQAEPALAHELRMVLSELEDRANALGGRGDALDDLRARRANRTVAG